MTARAADFDPVLADLLELHVAPVAADVGQQIRARIADFVDDLFGDRLGRDAATGVRRLGRDEAAVRLADRDREAHAIPVIGDQLPIGARTAGGLCAAFDYVAGKAAGTPPVGGTGRPLQSVDPRTAPHRADRAP